MTAATPLWVDVLTAVLVVVGSLTALVGSFGILRLREFFQRVHAPTLNTTVGVWCLVFATIAQVSFVAGQLFVHAAVILVLMALTTPVTTIFLMRAAIFRTRARELPRVTPESTEETR